MKYIDNLICLAVLIGIPWLFDTAWLFLFSWIPAFTIYDDLEFERKIKNNKK